MFVTDVYARLKNWLAIIMYPTAVFYPVYWHGITDIRLHEKLADSLPPESCMFQYGYSTNSLASHITAASAKSN